MFNSLLGKIGISALSLFFLAFGLWLNNGWVLILGMIAMTFAYFSLYKPKPKVHIEDKE